MCSGRGYTTWGWSKRSGGGRGHGWGSCTWGPIRDKMSLLMKRLLSPSSTCFMLSLRSSNWPITALVDSMWCLWSSHAAFPPNATQIFVLRYSCEFNCGIICVYLNIRPVRYHSQVTGFFRWTPTTGVLSPSVSPEGQLHKNKYSLFLASHTSAELICCQVCLQDDKQTTFKMLSFWMEFGSIRSSKLDINTAATCLYTQISTYCGTLKWHKLTGIKDVDEVSLSSGCSQTATVMSSISDSTSVTSGESQRWYFCKWGEFGAICIYFLSLHWLCM